MKVEKLPGCPEVFDLMGESVRFEYYVGDENVTVRAVAWKQEAGQGGGVSESSIADLRGKWSSRAEAEDAIMKAAKIALSAR